MKTLDVYLGWDSRASLAFDVARSSIVRRTKHPIRVMPIKLGHLNMFTRPMERRDGQLWCPISEAPMSTEFAISRFCVPFLQDSGWALFADCDMLCWSDIAKLFALADNRFAVMVVKHPSQDPDVEYWLACGCKGGFIRRSAAQCSVITCKHHGEPSRVVRTGNIVKMDGQQQTYYNCKNWSSVVLWNCDHPANKRFHVEHLNTWPGRDLHAFKWLNDSEIGEIPQEWNWLINVTPGEPEQKGIWHYTLGGPWFPDWETAKYDESWVAESGDMVALECALSH